MVHDEVILARVNGTEDNRTDRWYCLLMFVAVVAVVVIGRTPKCRVNRVIQRCLDLVMIHRTRFHCRTAGPQGDRCTLVYVSSSSQMRRAFLKVVFLFVDWD